MRCGFKSWVQKILWRREWQLTPVFLPGECHGQRSLVGSNTPGFPVITNSQNLPKLMSIDWVIPSNQLILCCPLLLLPSIFPGIRVFSNELALPIKYWSFSFSISPSNVYSGFISFRIDWFDLLAVQHSCLSPYQKVLDKDSSADIQSWGTALTFLRCSFFLKNKWKGFFDSRNV